MFCIRPKYHFKEAETVAMITLFLKENINYVRNLQWVLNTLAKISTTDMTTLTVSKDRICLFV